MSGHTYHGCSSPWKDKTQGPCACSSPITSSLFWDFRRLSLRFPGTHVGYCLLTSSQGSLEADLISLAVWPLPALWIPLCPILVTPHWHLCRRQCPGLMCGPLCLFVPGRLLPSHSRGSSLFLFTCSLKYHLKTACMPSLNS